MTKIWYVPIEPLEERYTASWYVNIPKFFREKGAEVYVIEGATLTKTVEVGTFLDINSTVYYKSFQLAKIADLFRQKLIHDGDMFFFGDVEFWGLESVRLLAQMNKVDVKLFGFLHAASYTKEDAFSVAAQYQQWTEMGWIEALDKVFVGSNYHKRAICDRRAQWLDKKIFVTGNPMFKEDYKPSYATKKKKLIISNRFDWEKRPNLSLDFAYLLKKRNPDLQIRVITSRPKFTSNRQWLVDYARRLEEDGVLEILAGLTKDQYHAMVAQSTVMLSNTIEENFGYCVAEACHYGCIPIIQNAFSHPELVQKDKDLLFDTEDEIIEKVENALANNRLYHPHFSTKQEQVKSYSEPYFKSMDRIWEEMLGRYNNG